MYFLDEKRTKKVLNCPSCSATFIEGKGTNCLDNCPAKQLENKHEKVIYQIINHCFPGREIEVKHPLVELLIGRKFSWGWTHYSIGEINIPWYTLRIKRMFIHCIAHEVGHITDYEKKFTVEERKIIEPYSQIIIRYQESFGKEERERLLLKAKLYKKRFCSLINRWERFWVERHSRTYWYQEYLKNHRKIINSHWREYAYGNFSPLTYELLLGGENWG